MAGGGLCAVGMSAVGSWVGQRHAIGTGVDGGLHFVCVLGSDVGVIWCG
jgi:hypothetical protein